MGNIPEEITRKHILDAIKEIDRNCFVPLKRESIKYSIKHKTRYYPPKYTISLANKSPNGIELEYDEFYGGEESNSFLRRIGFEIAPCSSRKTVRRRATARY